MFLFKSHRISPHPLFFAMKPLRDRAGRLVYIDMTQHVKCDDDRSFETRVGIHESSDFQSVSLFVFVQLSSFFAQSSSPNLSFLSSFGLLKQWQRKFYSGMVASEDVETQRKGCVGVFYAVDAPNVRYELGFLKRNNEIMEGMPLRFDAIHMCHNNYLAWGGIIAMFQIMSALTNTMRLRVHYGTYI